MHPTTPQNRIETIDVLRGFAVFGILVVNMTLFKSVAEYLPHEASAGLGDSIVRGLIRFLLAGKFYLLFTFLFGLGFHLQMSRAADRGAAFGTFFARRLAILFLIGAAHALFLWSGDILAKYALAGIFLLLFRNASPRALVSWAVALVVISLILLGVATGQGTSLFEALAREAQRVYATGSYGEIREIARMELGYSYHPLRLLATLTYIFAYFLVGLAVGKSGILLEPIDHKAKLQRAFAWGLVIGIIGNAIMLVGIRGAEPGTLSPAVFVATLAIVFGGPALAMAYVTGIALLDQSETGRRVLKPLAPVGRMALTNYLMHSAICTTLFYGYGLGLYGKVGAGAGLLISIAIFLVQVLVSNWWLSRFRFGPAEWVWRTLTYGGLGRSRESSEDADAHAVHRGGGT